MENKLESLMKTITTKKKLVSTLKEVNDIVDPHSRRTKIGHINRAKEDLKELFLEYRTEVQARSTFIIATGSMAEKYAEIAKEEFSCFILDGDVFYSDIIDQIPDRLYNNYMSSPGLFDFFSSKFEDLATDIGIIGFPALIFESKYKKMLKDKKDALALMKIAFNDKVGSEVVGLDAVHRVAEQAIKTNFSGSTIPIVMIVKDESMVKDLSKGLKMVSSNIFIISTGGKVSKDLKNNSLDYIKSVNKEDVEKSLVKVKKNLA